MAEAARETTDSCEACDKAGRGNLLEAPVIDRDKSRLPLKQCVGLKWLEKTITSR